MNNSYDDCVKIKYFVLKKKKDQPLCGTLCASTYLRELLSRKWLKLDIKVNNFFSGFNFWIAPHTEIERERDMKHTFYSLISHLVLKFLK